MVAPGDFSSTVIVQGGADPAEYREAKDRMEQAGAAMEHCPNCNALLDVSGCSPLTETSCPSCHALIKVLKEFHHFSLMSVLGKGGSGTVYRAFDHTLERDVALKMLHHEDSRDPKYIDGLEREALITASISHPHVVKVYSTGRRNGIYYVAAEIVPGGSLADKIHRQGRLSEARVLNIGIQVAEGLQAALDHGLLHRDVKPGNILFANDETAKVSDFGLARPLDQALDRSEDLWGTPDYVAPEKLLRKREDARSDIYSLGCTLFHSLAGFPPLSRSKVMTVLRTSRPITPLGIHTFVPEISNATALLIKRCLEPEPDQRFFTYHELIEQLRYALQETSKAPPIQVTKRSKAPAKAGKKPAIPKSMAISAMAAALVCTATVGVILAARSNAPSRGRVEGARAPAIPPATSAPVPMVNQLYEAEDATLFGGAVVQKDHTNYSGAGFVAGFWNVGATTRTTVVVPAAGNYRIRVHYGNSREVGGRKVTLTLGLYINDVRTRQMTFPPLPNWDVWADVFENVNLNSGANSIMLRYDPGDAGNVNLDYIVVSNTLADGLK